MARYAAGDLVFSSVAVRNDGSMPGLPDEALLAAAGTRGVVVQVGHLEAKPDVVVYLVRFEEAGRDLGPPVGCLEDELTQEELAPGLAGG